MSTTYDLVVVGGGPVGLATAVMGATAGMRVAVVESRTGPVDKACGEGLMPSALHALGALGVDPPGRPIAGIAYLDGTARAEARFGSGRVGRGVRRTTLSAALTARADEVGVQRVAARAGRPLRVSGGVEVAGLRSRWLAAADGLHSPIRRELGLGLPTRDPARYGLRRHYAIEPWTDLVEVHWGADAEAYVTPVGEQEVGVAVLSGGGRSYDSLLADFPALVDRLAPALPSSAVRGAGPLRQRVRALRLGPVFLVGDAAGYVDALTGEGIAIGLQSGRVLVDCLASGHPERYAAACRAASRRSRTLTETLLWASSRPALRAGLVPSAQRLPLVYRAAVRALA